MADLKSTVRGTGVVVSNKLVIDMSNKITLLDPNAAPLTVLLMKMRKKSCYDPKFEWMEDDLQARWDAINLAAGYSAGAVSLIVDEGHLFAVGDIVKVPRTAECFVVTVVSTDTLTVTRAYGETSAATMVDNEPLVIIGNASAEGATKPTLKSTNASAIYNYTQIFRTPFGVTGTAGSTKMYGGEDISFQRMKKGIEHKVDIERSFLFGERKLDTSGGQYKRTTRGLLKFISTNVTAIAGLLTKNALDEFCEDIFRYGSSKKVLLCSPTFLTAVSILAGNQLQTVSSETTYGIAVKEYLSPHGTLLLVKHNLLENSYGGHAIAVDMANITYRFLEGRDTRLKTGIQDNDEDSDIEEYITEAGLQVDQEKTHGLITGVTGA